MEHGNGGFAFDDRTSSERSGTCKLVLRICAGIAPYADINIRGGYRVVEP